MSFARHVLEIAERVKPELAGKHPAIQGAVLADLLATWLAGHPSEVREELLQVHLANVRTLVPVNEAIINGG